MSSWSVLDTGSKASGMRSSYLPPSRAKDSPERSRARRGDRARRGSCASPCFATVPSRGPSRGSPDQEMRIVVAGCGRVGAALSVLLADRGHDVSVIDVRQGSFDRLGTGFAGTAHEGLAYDVAVMRSAGIESADAFVATTPSDNANAVAALIASRCFGVATVVARLADPAREETYRVLGVPFVDQPELMSDAIEHRLGTPTTGELGRPPAG